MMLKVKQITYGQTKPFILGIHYARRMPCIQYAFGLFQGSDLIGVVTYGQPASPTLCKGLAGEENRKNVIELNRLVLKPECSKRNYASYLVSHSLKMLPNRTFVVSYADSAWGHIGYVYQATNFIYTGQTKARTDIYTEGHSRHYNPNETRRKYRSAKHRYVYLVGNRRERKDMYRALKYGTYDYPKGEIHYYDIENPTPLQSGEEFSG